ncbi:hypothetical protein ANCCAN_30079 [Ancylostoma caninum]|uniref:Uncharacterized protein n=1 Tax=Ancylostoma caninum TaxID=29170 RepID=A0A368EZK4_ANCCA|nr:hypothetical protein ANCCAN_30079 [Ancylostoma caninum]
MVMLSNYGKSRKARWYWQIIKVMFLVDWAVIVMLAQRQGAEGNDAGFRVMVKHVIHYVPLFGWYIFQVCEFCVLYMGGMSTNCYSEMGYHHEVFSKKLP